MPNYLFRQDTVFNKVGSHFDPGVLFTVTVYRPGAICTVFNSGTATVTVAPGHGFQVGDLMMAGLDPAATRFITAATSTTLSWSGGLSISQSTKLVNLGPEITLTPTYKYSGATIYSRPDGTVIGTAQGQTGWASRTTSAVGEYEFWRTPDELWELTRNSSGTPIHIAIIPGQEVVVTLYPTSGLTQEANINNAIAEVAAGGGGIVQLGAGTFKISSAIFIKSNVWLRGNGPGTVIQMAAAFQDIVPSTGNLEHLYGMISAGDRGSEYTVTNPISGIRISDMTFDFNSLWCYAPIKIGKVNDCLVDNVVMDAHSHIEAGNPLKFGIELDPTATVTIEGLGSGRLAVRGCTFKGFGDFNANIVGFTGGTSGAHEIAVESCTFDTCVAFCVSTPNGRHENISIVNNRFYACSLPINLEGTNPNYVRNCLISGNVMTGLPLTAGPSGYPTMGKIAIWLFLGSPGVESGLVHYVIQITNNIITGYQEIVHGTGGHLRFANNFCYDWGMGPSGGSGLVLGQAAGSLELIGNIAIEDNYFYQTTARIASGIHGTINIDTTNSLAGIQSFSGATATLSTGTWASYGIQVGTIIIFSKSGGLNHGVIATVLTVAGGNLTATASVFTAEVTSGYSVSPGPIDNVVIRGNNFNGQDTTPGLSTQHVILASVTGSNWVIEANNFRNSTNWPIRIGGNFSSDNLVIARNTFFNCAAGTPTAAPSWITLGNAASRNVVVVDNIAIDETTVRAPGVVFTTTTITRQTGNWINEGLSIGTVITLTKAGGANTARIATITAITPLVLTASAAPFVAEGTLAAPVTGYSISRPSRIGTLVADNNTLGSSFFFERNYAPQALSIAAGNPSITSGEDLVVTRPSGPQVVTYNGDVVTHNGEMVWKT